MKKKFRRLNNKQQIKAQSLELDIINYAEANSIQRLHGDMFTDAGGHIIHEDEIIRMMEQAKEDINLNPES